MTQKLRVADNHELRKAAIESAERGDIQTAAVLNMIYVLPVEDSNNKERKDDDTETNASVGM